MYAAQHTAAPSAKATPSRSASPVQGCVSSSTPIAASPAQARARPRPRQAATPSGPRNSSALAVPSGSRSIAAMNSIVTPAVTTPRAMPARSAGPENCDSRGRTMTSISTPAHASRSHAVPCVPRTSIRPTEAASPSWTQIIEASASPAPVRAAERPAPSAAVRGWSVMRPVKPRQPCASTRLCWTYRSAIMNTARRADPPPPHPPRALPPRVDARGRRRARHDHLERVPAHRRPRRARSARRWWSRTAGAYASPRPDAGSPSTP